ncbi:hypothetical protein A6A04_12915 [Paramagnetospirillum marisnigri]|uniref:Uncharacterized protein n=1 Tax=Paramagnetospirillum marisnigri TaxID=1285242 RepID=A0A178MXS2_9PROT|nr:hypothetical protein [Paramagnetospirillum marisnigri]OAN54135.1 hypothetical protein A6A04_12915 [Paramagnetospirillum marisnigri]
MIGWLQTLFLDKRAREALRGRTAPQAPTRVHAVTVPPPERDIRTALAEAEDRMRRLPPEKAQLIRSALLVRRASQSALAQLSEDEVDKLRQVAEKAMLGGGR